MNKNKLEELRNIAEKDPLLAVDKLMKLALATPTKTNNEIVDERKKRKD